MPRSNDIQIRDPFVLPVEQEKRYYLFGTTDKDPWNAPGLGFNCYKSNDLQNWDGPIPAFRRPPHFWGRRHFWAPEVHPYKGRFFMFATFAGDGIRQGTAILASETPDGPYIPHSDGAVTPKDWEGLDGTFFVEDGQPWMVFCREWVQVQDGQICAMRLTGDLTRPATEPTVLFRASEAPWIRPHVWEGKDNYVTDGPFMYRTASGELLMMWSSFDEHGYAVGIAVSESGKLCGPWKHHPEPLYSGDGGHGMLFKTFDGKLKLALHSPNDTPNERPIFIPVQDKAGRLTIE